MLRLIAGLTVTAASILIGCYLSSRLTRRRALLSDYIALLDEAANRLSCTGMSLAAVFSENFSGFAFDPSVAFAPQWERMADQYRDVLGEDDRRVLRDFAKELGNGDLEAQLNRIRLYQQMLKGRLADADHACEKKGSLCRILPFSIGLVITIIML